jgi:hypothetical protein
MCLIFQFIWIHHRNPSPLPPRFMCCCRLAVATLQLEWEFQACMRVGSVDTVTQCAIRRHLSYSSRAGPLLSVWTWWRTRLQDSKPLVHGVAVHGDDDRRRVQRTSCRMKPHPKKPMSRPAVVAPFSSSRPMGMSLLYCCCRASCSLRPLSSYRLFSTSSHGCCSFLSQVEASDGGQPTTLTAKVTEC